MGGLLLLYQQYPVRCSAAKNGRLVYQFFDLIIFHNCTSHHRLLQYGFQVFTTWWHSITVSQSNTALEKQQSLMFMVRMTYIMINSNVYVLTL